MSIEENDMETKEEAKGSLTKESKAPKARLEKPEKPQKLERDPRAYLDDGDALDIPPEFIHEGFHQRMVRENPKRLTKVRRKGYEIAYNEKGEAYRDGSGSLTSVLVERPLDEHELALKAKQEDRVAKTIENRNSGPEGEGLYRHNQTNIVELPYGRN